MPNREFAIAIHGGAGTISRDTLSPEQERIYKGELEKACTLAYECLKEGKSAVLAVETAVKYMEDCPLFNAGHGAVFNSQGQHEMEASIMCGKDLQAGAISAVKHIKNPIALAKKVLESQEFVYLNGEGAELFAKLNSDVEFVGNSHFSTKDRFEQWQVAKGQKISVLDHDGAAQNKEYKDTKFGTVGAVALDIHGNIAAATSTGGLTNKKFGRLGDSSIIGSGTYANNSSCAVSCTGYGEFFIRFVVAHDVASLVEYANYTLQQACDMVINKKLVAAKGEGGLIAIDNKANVVMSFNTEGMYRAYAKSSEQGKVHSFIYQ